MVWIFGFFLVFHSMCSGMDAQVLSLESRVLVAIKYEDLTIKCNLKLPNQSQDTVKCFNPSDKEIYSCIVTQPTDPAKTHQQLDLHLKNLTMSGEYYCVYQGVTVYWFLQVRDDTITVPQDNTELILVVIFNSLLLVFSVAGSVYVFKGSQITKRNETCAKPKQNREERRVTEREEDNTDIITAPSTSFYASLEPRPRSIYEVLDHSAAKRLPDERRDNSNGNQTQNKTQKTTQQQEEGKFECVYENF